MADELVLRGYLVIILLPGSRITEEEQNENLIISYWPSKRPTKIVDAIFLAKIILKYKPISIIGNFGAVNWIVIIGFLLSVRNRIVWYHTLIDQLNIDNKKNKLILKLLRLRKKIIYGLATNIVAVSEFSVKNDLHKSFNIRENKITIHHNLKKDIYAAYKPIKDPIKLVTVARLDASKGHDILFKALKIVIVDYPNTKLTIIGDGCQRQQLEILASDLELNNNIEFLGKIAPSEVINEYLTAFLCVHPTRVDNCPLAVIEAMACGLPIVSSKTGGIPELVIDGVNGLLVFPEDIVGLAKAICKVVEDPKLHQSMAENSKLIFREKFELEKGVQVIADWIQSLEMKEGKIGDN